MLQIGVAFDPRLASADALCRAVAPLRAYSFPGSAFMSSISPVAIRMIWTALPITSAGRFSPLGPRGIVIG